MIQIEKNCLLDGGFIRMIEVGFNSLRPLWSAEIIYIACCRKFKSSWQTTCRIKLENFSAQPKQNWKFSLTRCWLGSDAINYVMLSKYFWQVFKLCAYWDMFYRKTFLFWSRNITCSCDNYVNLCFNFIHCIRLLFTPLLVLALFA